MNTLQKQTCLAIVNIFESGRILGNYGAIAVLKGDSGHLSYGRSQASLGSGNLFSVIKAYCDAPDALFRQELSPFLLRLGKKDATLDVDPQIKMLLKQAGSDPVMMRVQDDFFERGFFLPAMAGAQRAGLRRPLSQTIVYDAYIQGSWGKCANSVNASLGPVGPNVAEEDWIKRYLEVRTQFLRGINPDTSYRPAAFGTLVSAGAWQLDLPVAVRGLTIRPESFEGLGAEPIVPSPRLPDPEVDSLPIIRPLIPYMRGSDVLSVQRLLNTAGLKISEDQIYGPFTQTMVSVFQRRKELKPDAIVGPQTWAALKTGGNAGAAGL